MKRSIILVFLLVVLISATGQNSRSGLIPRTSEFDNETTLNILSNGGKSNKFAEYKSLLSNNYSLDSAVNRVFDESTSQMVNEYKEHYFYDENGNLTLRQEYDWSPDINSWDSRGKRDYHYNNNLDLVESTFFKWDDNIQQWYPNTKDEKIFNSENQLLKETYYRRPDNQSELKIMSSTEYNYDVNGNIILSIYSMGESLNRKETYNYDLNGSLIEHIHYYWDPNSTPANWRKSFKDEYIYDDQGFEVGLKYYLWQQSSNQWDLHFKRETTNNFIGDPTLRINYEFEKSSSSFVVTGKTEFTYDSNGNRLSLIFSDWDMSLDKWVLDQKSEDGYNEDGQQTLNSHYQWDANTNSWTGDDKEEFVIDSEGYTSQWLIYKWDYSSADWINSSKKEFSYDENGNPTMEIWCVWDSNTSQWVNSYKDEYLYDQSSFVVDYSIPYIDFGPKFPNKIANKFLADQYFTWNEISNEWILDGETKYYYSGPTEYYFTKSDSICAGDSLLWQGKYYSEEGTYSAKYSSVELMDSIYELALSVHPSPSIYIINGQSVAEGFETCVYSAPENAEFIYSWLVENGNIIGHPSDNAVQIQWGSSGFGKVYSMSMSSTGCVSDTAVLRVTIGSTSTNIVNENDIRLYPNPTYSILNINIPVPSNFERIRIIDNTGKVIREEKVDGKSITLQLGAIPSGIYIFELKGETDIRTTFIKQ